VKATAERDTAKSVIIVVGIAVAHAARAALVIREVAAVATRATLAAPGWYGMPTRGIAAAMNARHPEVFAIAMAD
jgi:hypothetical protein